MNLTRTALTAAALAAALCAPLATGAIAQAAPDTSQTTTHATTGTPHPGPDESARPKKGDTAVPTLPSAPLKGLPTLREAQTQGLLARPLTATGEVTAQAFPDDNCTTPPQGWGYHDYLAPGECLTPDTYIAVNTEPGGWYELWMQSDGNVVLYFHGAPFYTAKWQTGTRGSNASLWMQRDGNVVIYDGAGNPMWATGTNGCGDLGAWLRVQADTNLVLYTRDWTPIWARFGGPGSRPC
ncbi:MULTISPECIES: hypothetical protein [Streptomyces]|uniref:Bulb-type lectin domain-containing protein n=1 Tax=Streptomyces nymphaeiformis TaxID=2663842 RepID=A0A7W7U7C5_9ACTN|nr:hypothetical protein [Streptomyces nymphaeiformis]MBB4986249.1 hypothetical protein [Streptomyces nymphaeiformis]